jgi:hypothetical protein
MGEGRSVSGQWHLFVPNVPKRLPTMDFLSPRCYFPPCNRTQSTIPEVPRTYRDTIYLSVVRLHLISLRGGLS